MATSDFGPQPASTAILIAAAKPVAAIFFAFITISLLKDTLSLKCFKKFFKCFFFSFINYVNIYHLIYVNSYIYTILCLKISSLSVNYLKLTLSIRAIVYEDNKFSPFQRKWVFLWKILQFLITKTFS